MDGGPVPYVRAALVGAVYALIAVDVVGRLGPVLVLVSVCGLAFEAWAWWRGRPPGRDMTK